MSKHHERKYGDSGCHQSKRADSGCHQSKRASGLLFFFFYNPPRPEDFHVRMKTEELF